MAIPPAGINASLMSNSPILSMTLVCTSVVLVISAPPMGNASSAVPQRVQTMASCSFFCLQIGQNFSKISKIFLLNHKLLRVRLFHKSYTRNSTISTRKKGNIILNALVCKRFNKSARNTSLLGIWDETIQALEHASHSFIVQWQMADRWRDFAKNSNMLNLIGISAQKDERYFSLTLEHLF
jgi:hypothetical protein